VKYPNTINAKIKGTFCRNIIPRLPNINENVRAPIRKKINKDLIDRLPARKVSNGLLTRIFKEKINNMKFSKEETTANAPLMSKNNGRYRKVKILNG